MITTRSKPKVALEPRIITEQQRGGYTALGYRSARVARREGRHYGLASGAAHERYDRPSLVKESRAHYRDNAIYKGMVDRAVGYIVGQGFALQVQTGNAKTDAKIEELWTKWWARPEISGMMSGADVGQMVMRELILAGDTAAVKTNKGVLQLIESEQLAASRSKDGIDRDRMGSPIRYWVSRYKDSGGLDIGNAAIIRPVDMMFIANLPRLSSVRGVPALQSAFAMLHRINDVCDAEAIAWQMVSRLAVSITQEQGAQKNYIESEEDDTKGSQTGQITSRVTELDYALIFRGEPGDEIKGIDRNIPGMNFPEALRMFMRVLGLPMGLPLELVLLDWTKSNYSQSRAVLEQAYQTFASWQAKIIEFFLTPAFEWKLGQWRKSAGIKNKDIPFNWIKPSFPWLDQLKEAQASSAKVERAFMTHGEVCKSRGQDRTDVVTAREKEVRDAIARAQQIEQDTGTVVAWELFAGLEVPKAATTPAPDTQEPESSDHETNNKPGDAKESDDD